MATDVILRNLFLMYSHNVAPTYVQPVIRQVGDRNNDRNDASADSQHSSDTPADSSISTDAPQLPKSPTKDSWSKIHITAKPGDLIVQSMKYPPFKCR